jgi:hypothetical protein
MADTETTLDLKLMGHLYKNATPYWAFYMEDPSIPALAFYVDEGYGREPLAAASVNVPGRLPAPGCIIVKDYGECEGMFDSLVAAGMIEGTGVQFDAGWPGTLCREGRVLSLYIDDMKEGLARG